MPWLQIKVALGILILKSSLALGTSRVKRRQSQKENQQCCAPSSPRITLGTEARAGLLPAPTQPSTATLDPVTQ